MKRLLLLLALLCGLASAQVNVINTDVGPYHVLGRSLIPAQVGTGGLSNYFIYTPLNPTQGACLYMYNDTSTAATGVGYTIFQTGDPSVAGIAGNTAKWIQTATQAIASLAGNGIFPYYIQPSSAARVAILSGGAGATTIDLIAVETANGAQCGSYAATSIYCPFSISATVATGTTVQLKASVPAFIAIHVCSYQITIAGATVTAAANSFIAGTGATCGGATATLWRLNNGATSTQFALTGAVGGQLFETNFAFSTAGQVGGPQLGLCYVDGGTTAGSQVNITYNSY